ncbi:MAG: hypothetical protein MJ245_04905 [Clostridia bacterium]|nr:hypothetical protein [Clostridia bacterium]
MVGIILLSLTAIFLIAFAFCYYNDYDIMKVVFGFLSTFGIIGIFFFATLTSFSVPPIIFTVLCLIFLCAAVIENEGFAAFLVFGVLTIASTIIFSDEKIGDIETDFKLVSTQEIVALANEDSDTIFDGTSEDYLYVNGNVYTYRVAELTDDGTKFYRTVQLKGNVEENTIDDLERPVLKVYEKHYGKQTKNVLTGKVKNKLNDKETVYVFEVPTGTIVTKSSGGNTIAR